MPAPRKFQKPTATRNITAQRCGNGVCERDSCAAPSCRNDHASTVRNVSGITSAAEKNAPSAMCSAGSPEKYRWCIVPITPPTEYRMMSRKIDRQRDLLAHDAEQHEHVGDHHRGEELEEVLDPQVHDPEAPELGRREVVAGAGEQPDRVEGRDRAARRGRTATACCPRCSPRSRPRSPRQSMNTQTNSPIDSRTCQSRARSRYSKPCRPNQFDAAPSSTPWMPR